MWLAIPMLLLGCGRTELDDPMAELCASCDRTCSFEDVAIDGARHVTDGVTYADPPPAGGDHHPCWTSWGVHDVDPGAEHWVHNMEHGGVVFLYRCPDGCADDVAELTALVAELGEGTAILTPYDPLPTRFGATAWGHRYLTDCFDPDAMRTFYDRFVDQAPESITAAPSAGCMETGTGGDTGMP